VPNLYRRRGLTLECESEAPAQGGNLVRCDDGAGTLPGRANVLLLDEPTNDLDVNTLRALEDALEQFAGCVVVISHDRWFLDRIATHILAFEGESKATFFDGNFSEYEDEEYRRKTLGEEASRPHRITYRKLTR
jgi:sulfate-transporting ATPase